MSGPSDSIPRGEWFNKGLLEKGYEFDDAAAARIVRFFETALVHVTGSMGGRPFEPRQWQKERILWPLFGWKRPDGTRLYRQCYVEVPRGNGKSTTAAGIATYMTGFDSEHGAQVYSVANDREQAHYVFDPAKEMIRRNPTLENQFTVYRTSIAHLPSGSRYVSHSSDAGTILGANAHCVIFDEIAEQPNRDMYEALRTSMGKREQPLMLMLTTAGIANRESIGWELADYARKVRDGVIEDDTFLPVIYEAGEEADWTDPEVWKGCNPNYGVSVSPVFLEEECDRAKASPAAQNAFRRFYLNQWVEQTDRFIDMRVWDECEELGEVEEEALINEPCYVGVDISSTIDLSAAVLVFPPESEDQYWEVVGRCWIPGDNVRKRVDRDRVPYDDWIADEWIKPTPGNVIDQQFIRGELGKMAGKHEFRQVGIDPWNSQQLQVELDGDGHNVVQYRQGFVSLNAPTKELLALLMSKQLRVGTNPVLRWNISNLVVQMDAAGNVKPDKGKATERIDMAVALIMGIGLAIADPLRGPSVYDEDGPGLLVV